jgi:hypothetical protein
MRLTLAPGATAWIAQRDPRRRELGIWITDPTNGINDAYIGPDVTTVLTTGVLIETGTAAPCGIVLTHADAVAIGAAAANPSSVIVNAAYEILE